MKSRMKFLAVGAVLAGAAVGIAAYRRFKDSYEELPEENQLQDEFIDEEDEFEQVAVEEDDFTYYIEDQEQILFYE